MIFGIHFLLLLFCFFQNRLQQPPKTTQRSPKAYELDTIFNRFGAPCKNDGFIPTQPSLWGLQEVPRHILCSSLRTVFSSVLLGTTLSRFFVDEGSKGGPERGPTNNLCSVTVSTLPPLGTAGEPRVAKAHPRPPKSFKIRPENDPRGCITTSQILANEPTRSKNKSINQSIHQFCQSCQCSQSCPSCQTFQTH